MSCTLYKIEKSLDESKTVLMTDMDHEQFVVVSSTALDRTQDNFSDHAGTCRQSHTSCIQFAVVQPVYNLSRMSAVMLSNFRLSITSRAAALSTFCNGRIRTVPAPCTTLILYYIIAIIHSAGYESVNHSLGCSQCEKLAHYLQRSEIVETDDRRI